LEVSEVVVFAEIRDLGREDPAEVRLRLGLLRLRLEPQEVRDGDGGQDADDRDDDHQFDQGEPLLALQHAQHL
jgi:hypothetical protein